MNKVLYFVMAAKSEKWLTKPSIKLFFERFYSFITLLSYFHKITDFFAPNLDKFSSARLKSLLTVSPQLFACSAADHPEKDSPNRIKGVFPDISSKVQKLLE